MVACRYGISALLFSSISHSFAVLTPLLNAHSKRNSAHVLFYIYRTFIYGRIKASKNFR